MQGQHAATHPSVWQLHTYPARKGADMKGTAVGLNCLEKTIWGLYLDGAHELGLRQPSGRGRAAFGAGRDWLAGSLGQICQDVLSPRGSALGVLLPQPRQLCLWTHVSFRGLRLCRYVVRGLSCQVRPPAPHFDQLQERFQRHTNDGWCRLLCIQAARVSAHDAHQAGIQAGVDASCRWLSKTQGASGRPCCEHPAAAQRHLVTSLACACKPQLWLQQQQRQPCKDKACMLGMHDQGVRPIYA